MPLGEAPAAARGRRVLGDEHGVAAKGRLLAVVARRCRRKARGDEVAGMRQHEREALALEIVALAGAKPEAAPERRPGKPDKNGV